MHKIRFSYFLHKFAPIFYRFSPNIFPVCTIKILREGALEHSQHALRHAPGYPGIFFPIKKVASELPLLYPRQRNCPQKNLNLSFFEFVFVLEFIVSCPGKNFKNCIRKYMESPGKFFVVNHFVYCTPQKPLIINYISKLKNKNNLLILLIRTGGSFFFFAIFLTKNGEMLGTNR